MHLTRNPPKLKIIMRSAANFRLTIEIHIVLCYNKSKFLNRENEKSYVGEVIMNCSDNRLSMLKKISLKVVGILLLILIASSLLMYNNATSNQAFDALIAQIYFDGEYRIGDGPWQEIVEGKHIPATKGDVTLKGNFHVLTPDGNYVGLFSGDAPIAFYTDHINLTIYEGDEGPYQLDSENSLYGKSVCGVNWIGYNLMSDGTEPMEIIIHNPHSFGNENAVDELLSNVAIWANIDFERSILEGGEAQRTFGVIFVIVAISILGIALFSSLLHVRKSQILWLIGLTISFAGGYFAYSDNSVPFWSDSVANNTAILGMTMMFYMLFMSGIITSLLQKTKKIGIAVTTLAGVFDGVCLILSMLPGIYFYDTWFIWVFAQSAVNVTLFVCMIREIVQFNRKEHLVFAGMGLYLVAFEVDAIATGFGWWQGGIVSKYIFVAMFIVALFVVLKIIPEGINAAEKAKDLELHSRRLEAEKNMIEAELKENRVAIMLSQIRPHFIYNTLGTIERMCLHDPQKAFNLVRDFSLYLRGNFSELESVIPIRFEEEIKHVECYVNIEKVRFPDMNIEYELEATDFVIPALSVQPLVENAIKHGLMRLEMGGSIFIRSYETENYFYVEVEDNGSGFDPAQPIDKKKHVGLHNIEERLKAMVNGELIVESKMNRGTKVKIMIPKEVEI